MLEIRGPGWANSGLLYHDLRIAKAQYLLAIRMNFSSQGGGFERSVRNVRPSLQGMLPESYRLCQGFLADFFVGSHESYGIDSLIWGKYYGSLSR